MFEHLVVCFVLASCVLLAFSFLFTSPLLLAVVALRLCLRCSSYCLRYLFFPLCMFTKHLIKFEFFNKVGFFCI